MTDEKYIMNHPELNKMNITFEKPIGFTKTERANIKTVCDFCIALSKTKQGL